MQLGEPVPDLAAYRNMYVPLGEQLVDARASCNVAASAQGKSVMAKYCTRGKAGGFYRERGLNVVFAALCSTRRSRYQAPSRGNLLEPQRIGEINPHRLCGLTTLVYEGMPRTTPGFATCACSCISCNTNEVLSI